MSDHHDYLALDWVKGEIDDTLKQARQALEAYVENSDDVARMRFCLNYLHQVTGTLQMVEFYGAALLSEEMEVLADALVRGDVVRVADAQEVLMTAMLQLPAYLERVQTSRRDLPMVLLPLFNDMRAVCGQPLMTETALFNPDLSLLQVPGDLPSALKSDGKLMALVKKLRQVYQLALLGIIRDESGKTNIAQLHKVLLKLEKVSGKSPAMQLWRVAAALVEVVSAGQLEIGTTVKLLLGGVDRHIKLLLDNGEEAFSQRPPQDVVKNLLYYIAKTSAQSPRIQWVTEHYRLDDALPSNDAVDQERARMAGPDQETMGTVTKALSEELSTVKDKLDLFVRAGAKDVQELEPLALTLKQVADTITVLGMLEPRKLVLDQYELLLSVIEAGRVENSEDLINVAGALLYIEASINGLSEAVAVDKNAEPNAVVGRDQLNTAQEAVLRECRAGLEQAKDMVVEYIASQWTRSHIETVPGVLTSVRGGLQIIPLPRASSLLNRLVEYINERLLVDDAAPDWSTMDTLADAITSVEYFLERFSDDSQASDHILDIAAEAINDLGYGLVEDEIAVEAEIEVESTGVDLSELPMGLEAPEEIELSYDEVLGTDSVDAPVEADDIVLEDFNVDVGNSSFSLDSLESEEHIVEESIEIETVDEQEEASAVEADLSVAAADEEDDLIDDEIIEIFVEESEEVLETLDEYFPRWAANQNDEDALVEFRRAFHTLKGSGRMVGASVVGELAWSVENMMNRVMDKSIETTPILIELVRAVRDVVPVLVAAFAAQRAPDINVQPLADAADALAEGSSIDVIPAVVSAAAESEELASEDDVIIIDLEDDSAENIIENISSDVDAEVVVEDVVEDLVSEDADTVTEIAAAGLLAADISIQIDPALCEVFTNESTQHIATLDAFVEEYKDDSITHIPVSDALMRALHTLKGSSRMAGITPVAEVVSPAENLFKLLRNNNKDISRESYALISRLTASIKQALDQIEITPLQSLPDTPALLEAIQAQRHALEQKMREVQDVSATEEPVPALPTSVLTNLLSVEMDYILEADEVLDQWHRQAKVGPQLPEIRRELTGLVEGAVTANQLPLAELCKQLERTYGALNQRISSFTDDLVETLLRAHEQVINMLDCLAAHMHIDPADDIIFDLRLLEESLLASGDEALAAGLLDELSGLFDEPVDDELLESSSVESDIHASTDLEIEPYDAAYDLNSSALESTMQSTQQDINNTAIPSETVDMSAVVSEPLSTGVDVHRDPELVEIFLEEADEILESVANHMHEWLERPDNLDEVSALQRELHTLKGGARMAEIAELGDLAHELENLYEGLCEKTLTAQPLLFDLLHACHDRIADQVDDIRANRPCHDGQYLIEQIISYMKDPSGFLGVSKPESVESSAQDVSTIDQEPVVALEAEAPVAAPLSATITLADDVDEEIIGIFLEEADELMEGLDTAISQWKVEPNNASHGDELKRILHTLKGGARLAGLTALGDVSHDLETSIINHGDVAPTSELLVQVSRDQDRMALLVDQIRKQVDGAEELSEPENIAPVIPINKKAESANLPSEHVESEPVRDATPPPQQKAAARNAQPQEMVRVSAELLEKLVNLAGETSINRGRIEQEVTDFSFSLNDMGHAIERLAEQLRRLDSETETQIMSNFQQGIESGEFDENFDPLEMDQYSELHQLTKQLTESASDLLDIRNTMLDKNRDTETLLLQQSRINTELQEGLMRSRMVPFSRLVPRLRRIVRQVASELDKQVDIQFINPEGELDRTLLERVVAPLEHMLRNAVDHGVEMPADRLATGKQEQGRISLTLTREGGDVVITLKDDGKGIDVNAVRKKAQQNGLIDDQLELTDAEVMQFIFQSGFSTAEKVTQISGRGVGMDVVSSEIKQMGGSVSIDSVVGEGTTFVVRLPFTVSVNRALMVSIGDDLYAVPLSQIEGIVRVSPYELQHYYSTPDALFNYAGREYKMQYLGKYVHNHEANLAGQSPLPILLVRGNDHVVALQVDSLIGSREVVVKSVGAQLSTVAGISGATILGDGRVVIILDVQSLIRAAMVEEEHHVIEHSGEPAVEEVVEEDDRAPLIMVTDDSVTVRKVTTRFLERQGFEVITAKDGVDAVAKLEEHKPDLMLLDIEMPRMDGFEVATHVRHNERIKDVPIVMITSRTGEKHRERAFELGVNAYMGKPFQEAELLEQINALLVHTRGATIG